MSDNNTQQEWISRAQRVLPAAGYGNFDPGIVIREGRGSHVWDENGKRYIDYLIGSGPMLLGHGHPEVLEAVQQQLSSGLTFFASNRHGIELAETICEAVPCAKQLRYVSTGGEADMYAMRLARAHTGKQKILKFEGGYHGMSAEALMSLSPPKDQLKNFPQATPDSAGIPEHVTDDMLIAPFNDAEAATQLIENYADELAAVIVEPLQRLIPPAPGFLQALRAETEKHGVVLIFDEVVTGFRLAYGGAQELYGVVPDLCTLGKVIGGGFPLAAITGAEKLLRHFDQALVGSDGFTFQMGTLSGNPVAAVAGLKTLEVLRRDGSYETLRQHGKELMQGLDNALTTAGYAHQIVGDPVLFDAVFSASPVANYRNTVHADADTNLRFNKVLREHGLLKSPSKLYPSLSLTREDIDTSIAAFKYAANNL